MTTYTDEVNIYNPEAVGEGITGAGQTATNYITSVTNDGIVVADAGKGASSGAITSGTTGWHLGGALEYIRSGVARFWIGLKDAAHDLTPTVIIGKRYVSGASDNESHMELDYHSMQMIDKEGNTYLHVSDLRDSEGYITDTFTGDGQTCYFYLSAFVKDETAATAAVTVDGEPVPWTSDGYRGATVFNQSAWAWIEFQPERTPASGAEIAVRYLPDDGVVGMNPKAFTFGSRQQGKNPVGSVSAVFGTDCAACSPNSFAQGLGTVATGYDSVALGRYNGAYYSADYALVIGNGTGPSDNDRSNAFAVKWDGALETATPLLTTVSGSSAATTVNHGATVNITVPITVPTGYTLVGVLAIDHTHRVGGSINAYYLSGNSVRVVVQNHTASTNWTDEVVSVRALCVLSTVM